MTTDIHAIEEKVARFARRFLDLEDAPDIDPTYRATLRDTVDQFLDDFHADPVSYLNCPDRADTLDSDFNITWIESLSTIDLAILVSSSIQALIDSNLPRP